MSRIFRKWVEEYQHQAWTLARYLLKDPSEAEDACQEAFVKLWRNQESIDPDKVRPWLMKVTRNGCLDRLRRRHPTEELQEWHQPDVAPGPMAVLELNLPQVKTYLHRARKQLRQQLAEVRP